MRPIFGTFWPILRHFDLEFFWKFFIQMQNLQKVLNFGPIFLLFFYLANYAPKKNVLIIFGPFLGVLGLEKNCENFFPKNRF